MTPGQSVDGWYVIQRIIGEGAGSVVYEATDEVIDETVAIKVLQSKDPGLRARFELEGRILHRLHDPRVPSTYVIGDLPDGSPYIVMERVTETLADRLDGAALRFDDIFEIGRQLLEACTCIHAQGIVHRDIKPSNIGLTEGKDGTLSLKLFDFGVCFVLGTGQGRNAQHEALIGTPEYMAPEQIRMTAVDQRTDLYAVGVVLYECITRRMPFRGGTLEDIVAAVLRDPVLSPAAIRNECSPALERVVLRAISRPPSRRFQTAAEMTKALASAKRMLSGSYLVSDSVFEPPPSSRSADDATTVHPLIRKKVAAALG